MKSGSSALPMNAGASDLAHQVHAHGVAAEREEGAVSERMPKTPDQIDGKHASSA